MTSAYTKIKLFIRHFFTILALISLNASTVLAQGMMGDTFASCPMCNNMGWGGMTLGVLKMISIIIGFIALVIFLIRRSRSLH